MICMKIYFKIKNDISYNHGIKIYEILKTSICIELALHDNIYIVNVDMHISIPI